VTPDTELFIPLDVEAVREAETVKFWLAETNSDPAGDEQRLVALVGFCNRLELGPDKLVAGMFRAPTEIPGKRIKLKRRKLIMAEILEWEAENGGRESGNAVRSFLIHNGIALTAAPIW
jgi:hypothetical protein